MKDTSPVFMADQIKAQLLQMCQCITQFTSIKRPPSLLCSSAVGSWYSFEMQSMNILPCSRHVCPSKCVFPPQNRKPATIRARVHHIESKLKAQYLPQNLVV